MKRLYEIDLLWIIAALAVVIWHYTFSGWMRGLSPVSFPGAQRALPVVEVLNSIGQKYQILASRLAGVAVGGGELWSCRAG